VSLSPIGNLLATTSKGVMLQRWEASTCKPIGRTLRHDNTIDVLAFSPDGRSVVAGDNGRSGRIWDVLTGNLIGILENAGPVTNAATFSLMASQFSLPTIATQTMVPACGTLSREKC
jgi:WD40 repeat protein